MLFNSYTFIFIFLPIVLIIFYSLGRYSGKHAAIWLVTASLFFYGWWNPNYVTLLILSIIFNYIIGIKIINSKHANNRKAFLWVGLFFDLSLLGYFKYANFFADNLNALLNTDFNINTIILPLGISFFTFTQIAFLVDAFRGEVKSYNFIHYILFITYFPHLIAGPIIHHREMIPQFVNPKTYIINYTNIAVGITVFFIGLIKKTLLADGVGPHAVALFAMADKGVPLTFFEAWLGCLCYTFQLYFDFSGYSDMAIGSSLMLGIRLPLNFHSPYKTVNIFEFWRRWHMTLSRFLREYIYKPLSQGRQKTWRLMVNLVITMILGGLWHGAGWNYLLWGGIHGFYLTVNHLWRNIRRAMGQDLRKSTTIGRFLGCALTFAAFTFSTALFRSQNLQGAEQMMTGMLTINGVALPLEWKSQFGSLEPLLTSLGISFQSMNSRIESSGFTSDAFKWVLYLSALTWLTPNTQQIMSKYFPAISPYNNEKYPTSIYQWEPNFFWSTLTAILAVIGLVNITKVSEFLYYQF